MTVWTPARPGMASGSEVNRLNPRMLPAIGDAAPTIRQPPATMPRRPTCWLVPWWWATAISAPVTIRPIRHSAVAHHHGTSQHVGRLGMVAGGCLIVGAASPIAGSILGFNLFTSDPEAIPGLAGVQTVIGYVSWVAAAVCLIGLIISGAMLAVSHQRGTVDSTGRLGGVAAGCLIVGSASTIIGALI